MKYWTIPMVKGILVAWAILVVVSALAYLSMNHPFLCAFLVFTIGGGALGTILGKP